MTGVISQFAIAQTTVIVLSAPSVNDTYYAPVFDSVIAYNIQFANTINATSTDRVLVVADNATMPYLQTGLPDSVLIEANINDIWIRDFSPLTTTRRVKFDYLPNYLSVSDANWIDNSFRNWFNTTGLTYDDDTPFIMDGGNFVWNRIDKAIVTQRVYSDNPSYTTTQVDSILKNLLNLQEICYLPEETGDITGHSDGMVMFIDTNHVLVNDFSYDSLLRAQVLNALTTGLTGITITEVPYPFDTTLWFGWPSACGLYLNSLVTENYVYMPTYGLPEDTTLFNTLQSNTNKTVIILDASNVCYMGGSVRCLTWVVTGTDADILINLANPTSVPEQDNEQGLLIYPNPSSSTITIAFKTGLTSPQTIKLLDISGKLVDTYEDISGNQFTIDTKDLTAGAYTIQLRNDKGLMITEKLVIK